MEVLKVSVVVIFLNAEKFMTETIKSVLAQTCHDWELLLVDDGSSDQSTMIAREYAHQFPDKIHYLEHPGHRNRGKSASRNLGVKNAKGEYIAFLDADDVFLPEKLERQAAILDHHSQAAMVYGPTMYWHGWTGKAEDIKHDKIGLLGVTPNQVIKSPDLMTLYLNDGGYIPCTCGLMVRKSILGAHGGWEENFRNLYEDQVFLAQIVLNYPVYVDGGVYDKYRQHPDMSSNQAIHQGEYNPDPSQTNGSQFAYFRWLSQYISRHKFSDENLKMALEKRLTPYKYSFMKKSHTWLAHFIFGQKCMPWFVILKWRKLLSFIQVKNRKSEEVQKKSNNRGIILMYHRIAKLDFDPRQLSVSPANFEEHLRIIKKYGRPIQMQEMGKNLKQPFSGTPEIVLTFDDGYTDNFQNAKPILEKYGISATFFIISGDIDSREEFFWDGLERTILAPQNLPEVFELTIDEKEFRWQLQSEEKCLLLDYSKALEGIPPNGTILSRAQLYSALGQIFGPLSRIQRSEALGHIAQWASQTLTTRPDSLPMTSDELMSLARCPLFEIGAHTVNHPSLGRLSLKRQEEEILLSKKDLENRLTRTITSFSYPHGSYSEDTVKIVEHTKFHHACTVVSQPVMHDSNPYLLPRFPVLDWNGEEFERQLQSWLNRGHV